MEDRGLRNEISDVEERIEGVAESLERCSKIILVSKISIMLGGMLMLATGLFRFDSVAMIVGATAVIGGIVLFGSTKATAKQTSAAMKDAESLRAQLISELDLRTVEETQSAETQPSAPLPH
jgi:uncharacterized membrane protein YuzA (DUF378 family)